VKGVTINVTNAMRDVKADDRFFYDPAHAGIAETPPVLATGHWLIFGRSLRERGTNESLITAGKLTDGAFRIAKAAGVVEPWAYLNRELKVGVEGIPPFGQVLPDPGTYVELSPDGAQVDFELEYCVLRSRRAALTFTPEDLRVEATNDAGESGLVLAGLDLPYLLALRAMGARMWALADCTKCYVGRILLTGRLPVFAVGAIMPKRI
jgi:hypothetical protein